MSTGGTPEIWALVDDIQAGDSSEFVEQHDYPVNITAGKTLATQLSINHKEQRPEWQSLGPKTVVDGEFSQRAEGDADTDFGGRVFRAKRYFIKPYPPSEHGTTVLEVLAVSKDIPLLLYYSFDGNVDLQVPAEGDSIRARGKLYCEPGFAYSNFYSPIVADILESRLLPEAKARGKIYDWGILRLRLRPDIDRFDLVGDDLKGGYAFVRVSEYNPSPTSWEAHVKSVWGRSWKRELKKTMEKV